MDFQALLAALLNSAGDEAKRASFVEAVWLAFILFILLLARKPIFGILFRLTGVDDRAAESEIEKKIDKPIQMLILILAALPFADMLPPMIAHLARNSGRCLIVLLLAHVSIQSIDLGIFRWFLRRARGVEFPPVFRAVILGTLYVATALVMLNWGLGVDVLPLLATSTVVTAVIGLALQDTLRNIVAGVNLTLEKTFKSGDWILFRADPVGEIVGCVDEIGWRSTRIRASDGSQVIVPNSHFVTNGLVNYSSPKDSNIFDLHVPVPSDLDPSSVLAALGEAARGTEGVLAEPLPSVQAAAIRDNHVDYVIRVAVASFLDRESVTGSIIERTWENLKAVRERANRPE